MPTPRKAVQHYTARSSPGEQRVRAQLHAAALLRIPLHGLRHSYASLALSSGADPRIVSGRLGHSTVALKLDIYGHVLPQQDQEAADRIAALIEL